METIVASGNASLNFTMLDETFEQKVQEYKKSIGIEEQEENNASNKILNILTKYYIYIIAGIILIVIITGVITINKKRGALE